MGQINVEINGKMFRMACDDGQEEHLSSLAKRFDTYIGQLRESFGEIGDTRLTVMAGVMVVDELDEAHQKVKALEAEIKGLRESREAAEKRIADTEANVAGLINECAARLEGVAHDIVNSASKMRPTDH